jgi:hypothetical protein
VRWRSSGKFGRLVARLTFYKSIIEKHVWKVRGENLLPFFLKGGGKSYLVKKDFVPPSFLVPANDTNAHRHCPFTTEKADVILRCEVWTFFVRNRPPGRVWYRSRIIPASQCTWNFCPTAPGTPQRAIRLTGIAHSGTLRTLQSVLGSNPNCVCTARWNNSCRPCAKSAKEINQLNQWPPFFHVFSFYPPGILGNYLLKKE